MAARYRLPTVYPWRSFAEVGGLLSYGVDLADNFRRAAAYVDRILKGEKPADRPVQAPTKYELVINLKTAKALGFTVPDHAHFHRRQGDRMRRREFILLIGPAAVWPLAARAQQSTMPVIGFLSSRSPNEFAGVIGAFRQGLQETGFAEGQNVVIAFRWAEGAYDRLPKLAADLVGLKVTVLFAAGGLQRRLQQRRQPRPFQSFSRRLMIQIDLGWLRF